MAYKDPEKRAAYMEGYLAKTAEHRAAYNKEYLAQHPEKARAYSACARAARALRLKAIAQEEYAAQERQRQERIAQRLSQLRSKAACPACQAWNMLSTLPFSCPLCQPLPPGNALQVFVFGDSITFEEE